ncbi:nucleoporin 62 isoform X2 [Lycorma delicatula]
MSLTFGSTVTPNKTTAPSGFSTSTPATAQAPGSGTSQGFGSFTLGAGDAKSNTGISFTPVSATTAASGQKSTGFNLATTTVGSSVGTTSFALPLTSSATPATASSIASTASSIGAPSFFGSVAQPSTLKLGIPASATTASSTTTAAIIQQSAGQTTTSTALVTSTTVTPSAPVSALTSTSMNYVQLEEIINKWTLELEEQEKLFVNQATQINAWDRLLVNNSEKIVELNNSVENVKLQQQQLDYELDFILAQQRELEECLTPLEKELASTPVNVDPQREHMYHMAENMDTQLKQMSEDLKEIIEHLNESSKTQDSTDPIVQIGRILNAHMNSLQWIDEHILQIQNKLDEVSKLHDIHRRENERSFRLTYE